MDHDLKELPAKKAKLQETKDLLRRLETRKEDISEDRYEKLLTRYEERIEEIEPQVEQLTEEGQTRKLELEDRLARQREKVEEAKAELEELEQLHGDGVLGKEEYKEDRRKYDDMAREARSKAEDIKEELEEIKFYLTEVGEEVTYESGIVGGESGASVEQVKEVGEAAVGKALDGARDVQQWVGQASESESVDDLIESTEAIDSQFLKWASIGLSAGILLCVLLPWYTIEVSGAFVSSGTKTVTGLSPKSGWFVAATSILAILSILVKAFEKTTPVFTVLATVGCLYAFFDSPELSGMAAKAVDLNIQVRFGLILSMLFAFLASLASILRSMRLSA